MLFNLIISDYFLSRRQLRTSKNTKTSFQSSLRFCGKFSEFFFFYGILISTSISIIGTHGATYKKIHAYNQKKLVYDDSFGADISSICTASIFIRIDVLPFFLFYSDHKNNL